MSTGTCTVHSWNDGAEDDEADPRMGARVDQRLEHDRNLYDDCRTQAGRPARRNLRSSLRSQRAVAADDQDDGVGW